MQRNRISYISPPSSAPPFSDNLIKFLRVLLIAKRIMIREKLNCASFVYRIKLTATSLIPPLPPSLSLSLG